MAEFLIKSCNENCNSLQDSHYCNGDIVDIRPDGFQWGAGEAPPAFYILKVPSYGLEDIKPYLSAWTSSSGTTIAMSKWKYVEESGVFFNKENNSILGLDEL